MRTVGLRWWGSNGRGDNGRGENGRGGNGRRGWCDKIRLLLLIDGREVSRGVQSTQNFSLDLFGELLYDLGRKVGGGVGMVKASIHLVMDRLSMGGLIVI